MSFDVVDFRQRFARTAKSPSRRLPSNADGFVVCSDCGTPFSGGGSGGGGGGGGGDNCCGALTTSFDGDAPSRGNRIAGIDGAVVSTDRNGIAPVERSSLRRSEMPTRNSTTASSSKNRSRSVEGRSAVDVRVADCYVGSSDTGSISDRSRFASTSGIRSTAVASRNVPPSAATAAGTRHMSSAMAPQPQWDGISVWVPNTSIASAASTVAGRRSAKSRHQQAQVRSTSTLSAGHETDTARRRQSAITISGGERRCAHQPDVSLSRSDATSRHQTGSSASQSVSAVVQQQQQHQHQQRWNGGQSVGVACHHLQPIGNGGVVVGDGGNPTDAISRRLYDVHTSSAGAMTSEHVECRTRHANLTMAKSVAGDASDSSYAVWRMRPMNDDVRVARKNASCVGCCAHHHVDRHAIIASAVTPSPWSSADGVADRNETESYKRSEHSRQTGSRTTMTSSGALSIDNGFDSLSECMRTVGGGSCGNYGESQSRTSTSGRPLCEHQQQPQSRCRVADEVVGSIVVGSEGRRRTSGTSDERQECDITVAAARCSNETDGGGRRQQTADEQIDANEAISAQNLTSAEPSCAISVARQKLTSETRPVGVCISSNDGDVPLSSDVTDDATEDNARVAGGGRDNVSQNLQPGRTLHPHSHPHPPRPPPRHESTSLCYSGTAGNKRVPATDKFVDDGKGGEAHANTLSPEEILNWKLSLMTCTDGENADRQQWVDRTSTASAADAAYANMTSDDDDDDGSDCNNAVNSETGNDVTNVGSPSANGGGSCVTCCNVSIFSFEDNFERALEEPCSCSAADNGNEDAGAANNSSSSSSRQVGDVGDDFEMQMDDLLIRRIDGVSFVDGVLKTVAHRTSTADERKRDVAIRSLTQGQGLRHVTYTSDNLALANGAAWREKSLERVNQVPFRSCLHSGAADAETEDLQNDSDAGLTAIRRQSAATVTSICCHATTVDAEQLTEVSRPMSARDEDVTMSGEQLMRFPNNFRSDQFLLAEHHRCPTANCSKRNVSGDGEKRGNGVDIVIDSSMKSSLEGQAASASFAGRVAHHIPYSACCHLEAKDRSDGDWSNRFANASATVGDAGVGMRQLVISSDLVDGMTESCRDDALRGPSRELATGRRVRLSAPPDVDDDDTHLLVRSVSCEDCSIPTSDGEIGDFTNTEKRLNAAVVDLLGGLVERMRYQQQLQPNTIPADFLERTCPDHTGATVSLVDLRDQFVRSSMAIVVDDVRRHTRRLQQRCDRLRKLAELGFDIRVDRKRPARPATVKKFVMTCRRQSKCGVDDDVQDSSSSSCPEEVNVFVLRDGVRIDGLHVSAPQSERDCDDSTAHVDVAQELGLQAAYEKAVRAIQVQMCGSDDDGDDDDARLSCNTRPSKQQQQQQQQQPQQHQHHSVDSPVTNDCLPPPPPDWTDEHQQLS